MKFGCPRQNFWGCRVFQTSKISFKLIKVNLVVIHDYNPKTRKIRHFFKKSLLPIPEVYVLELSLSYRSWPLIKFRQQSSRATLRDVARKSANCTHTDSHTIPCLEAAHCLKSCSHQMNTVGEPWFWKEHSSAFTCSQNIKHKRMAQ